MFLTLSRFRIYRLGSPHRRRSVVVLLNVFMFTAKHSSRGEYHLSDFDQNMGVGARMVVICFIKLSMLHGHNAHDGSYGVYIIQKN